MAKQTAETRPAADLFQLKGRVIASLVGVFLVFTVARSGVLWWQHGQALAVEQKRVENLALVLSEHLDRTVSAIEAALNQIAAHSDRIGGPSTRREAWAPLLDAAQSGLTGIGSLNLVDTEGMITLSTEPRFTGTDRRNTFLFQRLKDEPGDALVVGPPGPSAAVDGFYLAIGRPLRDRDGRFSGLAVATFLPETMAGFYEAIDVGPHGVIRLLHDNGQVFFRQPRVPRPEISAGADRGFLDKVSHGAASGFLLAPTEEDGQRFLTAWRRNSRTPIVVAVSLAEQDALAAWRGESIIVSGVAIGMALMLAIAGLWITTSSRAYARTVDERDRVDAALRESQARFQAIMDHTPLLVFVRDLQGRYTFVNRAAKQWLAATKPPQVGQTLTDIMSAEAAEKAEEVNRRVVASKAPIQHEWTLDTPIGRRTLLSTKFPLIDDAGKVWALGVISTDITNQKHAEAQLAHAQRMEAVGQLTGGIAHDFNNMLTAILLNADVLASQIQSDTLRPLAEAMRAAAERGADLTRRLLAFGRRQTLMPRATDVNDLLGGMEPLMHRTLGEHIDIRLHRGEGVWAATVDAGQLENAILNLAVNARDAMPNGGRLTIETSNIELDEDFASINPDVRPGQYVMIVVSDTGLGMSPDVVAHAFEPFYTTKDVGKGTGLGLSMVYGFVKQSGGHARIYSELGIGTVVRLYLPRSERNATSSVPSAASSRELAGGRETILFVEDDPLVRTHTEVQLRSLGYDVVTAEHAKAALDLVERGCKPDLLFTDMVMPGGLNGRGLASELRRRWPSLRVLYTSGYTHGAFDAIDAASGAAADPAPILAKPYRRRDLAAKVREVLDAPVAAAS